jgi:hypothetical protein
MSQSVSEESAASDQNDSRWIVLHPGEPWNAVRVFTAALREGANDIGDTITKWLESHHIIPVEVVIAQSAAEQESCISIGVFYREHRCGELTTCA